MLDVTTHIDLKISLCTSKKVQATFVLVLTEFYITSIMI